jgi:hypothetical protein
LQAAQASMAGQPGLFDLSGWYAAPSAAVDVLERLAEMADLAVLCGPSFVALRRSDRDKGDRPPFNPMMMFMILVLQALYSRLGTSQVSPTTS